MKERYDGEMKSVSIKLPTIEAVQEFVDTVGEFDADISLSSGRYIVDAKSIMGIFSLDLRMPITMTVDSDDCDDVFAAVDKYVVKSNEK
jgi:phosphotransferase system HPr-like phosphotransfer protein